MKETVLLNAKIKLARERVVLKMRVMTRALLLNEERWDMAKVLLRNPERHKRRRQEKLIQMENYELKKLRS